MEDFFNLLTGLGHSEGGCCSQLVVRHNTNVIFLSLCFKDINLSTTGSGKNSIKINQLEKERAQETACSCSHVAIRHLNIFI